MKKIILTLFFVLGCVMFFKDVRAAETFPTANLKRPTTNIIDPATKIQNLTKKDDLTFAMNQDCDTLVVSVNENLEVLNDSREKITDVSMDDVINAISGKAILAFQVTTIEEVSAVTTEMKRLGNQDYFIISSNLDALNEVKNEDSYARVVYYYKTNETSLDRDTCKKIVRDVSSALGNVIILDENLLSRELNKYFNIRLISVWGKQVDMENRAYALKATLSGVQGIISNSVDVVRDLYKEFPVRTLVREPIMVGHRGSPYVHLENTIEGAKVAFEQGADIVELDAHLTKDGYLVVHHDDSVNGVNIANMTLEQWQAIEINDGVNTYKLPTLEEYFRAFANEEDKFLNLELKSYDSNLVDKIKELLDSINDEIDIKDRLILTGFPIAQIQKAKQLLPEIPRGVFFYNVNGVSSSNFTVAEVYNKILNPTLLPLVAASCPNYGNATRNGVYASTARGILTCSWTADRFDTQPVYKTVLDAIFNNTSSITTDDLTLFDESYYKIICDNKRVLIELNDLEIEDFSYTVTNVDGSKTETTTKLQLFDDNGTGLAINGLNIIGLSGEGIAYGAVFSEFKIPSNDNTYTMYSEMIEVVCYKDLIAPNVLYNVSNDNVDLEVFLPANGTYFNYVIKNSDGEVIKEGKQSEKNIEVKGLLNGDYTITVSSGNDLVESAEASFTFTVNYVKKTGCSCATSILEVTLMLSVLSLFAIKFKK